MKYSKMQLVLILAPIALGTLTIFLVPHLLLFIINGLQENQVYWYLRSEPLLMLVLIATVSLFYNLSQKLYLRKAITLVSAVFFGLIAFSYIWNEIKRLSPYVGQQGITWSYALKFMDPMVVFGIIGGVVLLALQVMTLSPHTNKIKRAKKAFLEMPHG